MMELEAERVVGNDESSGREVSLRPELEGAITCDTSLWNDVDYFIEAMSVLTEKGKYVAVSKV
jgi:hypothetical protein